MFFSLIVLIKNKLSAESSALKPPLLWSGEMYVTTLGVMTERTQPQYNPVTRSSFSFD